MIRTGLFLVAILAVNATELAAALIPQVFFDCVVAVGYKPLVFLPGPDGKQAVVRGNFVPVASGFLYGSLRNKIDDKTNGYGVYLVTNQHVLDDVERLDQQQIAQASKTVVVQEVPTLWLRFNPKVPGRSAQEFSLPVHNPPLLDWSHDNAADLAVIAINSDVLRNAGIQFAAFESDSQVADTSKAAELGLTEGDGVYVLGFPMGLVGGERNFVIARQGIIARIGDALAHTTDRFLIDALIFPGNSGGPVILRPEMTSLQGTKRQDRAYLIGVVRGYIPYQDTAISQQTGRPRVSFEENSGLAEVIPIDAVKKLVEAKEKLLLGK